MGCGALGLIVAPLTLALREPPRIDGGRKVEAQAIPIREVAAFYRRHARALFSHNLGFCLLNFASLAGAAWAPTMLVRTLDWSIGQAGAVAGGMALLLGPTGSATAGVLADAVAKRGRTDGKLVVCIISGLICAMAAAVIVFAPTMPALLGAMALMSFFGAFKQPLAPAALQEIMPNAMRGQSVAIYVCVINLISGGFAATAVALVTDHVLRDPSKLHASYGLVGVTVCVVGSLLLLVGLGPYRRMFADTRLAPGALATV
jgi:sugar phosphate permease